MAKDDEKIHRNRIDAFDTLEDATNWLGAKATAVDHRMFDMEAARQRILARLVGDRRPDLPTTVDDFGDSRRVQSISDLESIGARLKERLEKILDNPEDFGVTFVSELDEETVLLSEQEES